MQKLKSVLGSSSRRKRQSLDSTGSSLQTDHKHAQHINGWGSGQDRQGHFSSESPKVDSHHQSRSQPLSSPHNGGLSNPSVVSQHGQTESSTDTIANDYKAYLPALASTTDTYGDGHVTSGTGSYSTPANSDQNHKEHAAQNNIRQKGNSIDASKRKPLPAGHGNGNVEMNASASPAQTTMGQLNSNSAAHKDVTTTSKAQPESHDASAVHNGSKAVEREVAINSPDEIETVTAQLLDGFVDLRNTVDTDKNVTIAPAVTHETIKPHEHEIVQHKIFREIHNYQYHHRVQPIYDLQVLPPRHWIPNPKGDGLIEVSADQLPLSTGNNRRWEIVQKALPITTGHVPKYRTEPEIIHHPSSITEEGFERKETTIIYPPTLADLTDYVGLVQPVHFDHKTGKRWLGEIVTMDKVQKQIDDFRSGEGMNMRELGDSLPKAGPPQATSSTSPGPNHAAKAAVVA